MTNNISLTQVAPTTEADKNKKNIYKDCEFCVYYSMCPKYPTCEYLSPTPLAEEQTVCDQVVSELRNKNCVTMQRKLIKPKAPRTTNGEILHGDSNSAIYSYYCDIINTCLSSIRSGRQGYLFKYSQIKEVLRFEPSISVKLSDGIFYISL